MKVSDNNFYTRQGVNVSDRIKKGLTSFYGNKKEAKDKAREKRTYFYEVCKKIDGRLTQFGYGVPK